MSLIGVFIGLLVLITSTGKLIWPSLAVLVVTVLCGYMTGGDAVAKFMGTTTIFQVVAILVICSALRETGAGKVIAEKIITAKFVQGRPFVFTMSFLLAFLFADIFLDTFGGIIFSLTIFESTREALGYEKNDKCTQVMTVGLYLCGMLGASLIPFAPMTVAITSAFGQLPSLTASFSTPQCTSLRHHHKLLLEHGNRNNRFQHYDAVQTRRCPSFSIPSNTQQLQFAGELGPL